MSIKVLYLGKSGNGKSTSYCKNESLGIEGLDPKTTGIINVAGKELNMRRWRDFYNKKNKNYLSVSKPDAIVNGLKLYKEKTPHIKNIIIDDFQYSLAFDFIDKIKDKNGFDKYNDVLLEIKKLFIQAGDMRDDQIVWILSHIEEYADESGVTNHRFKAVGKGTHTYITPEGLFENVLYADTIQDGEGYKKVIRVHGTDHDTCKTAPDLYPLNTEHIPNDLAAVEKNIRDYYNI